MATLLDVRVIGSGSPINGSGGLGSSQGLTGRRAWDRPSGIGLKGVLVEFGGDRVGSDGH
ncbi:hypothetical protein Pyn_24401 [Prunus yedoensis var. nudiflora]|uniref:Uncharacterized protein n=1 Tax=Prunus yedoensis var. nudiflora TaxID=2094558 RepID=A0A314YP59_PRUYE|nr:hypothetical protein Pyn_24401 [Prunus yedoensis var. nudiflora]